MEDYNYCKYVVSIRYAKRINAAHSLPMSVSRSDDASTRYHQDTPSAIEALSIISIAYKGNLNHLLEVVGLLSLLASALDVGGEVKDCQS